MNTAIRTACGSALLLALAAPAEAGFLMAEDEATIDRAINRGVVL